MKCLIEKVIESSVRKKMKARVVKRFIRMKYRIKLDSGVVKSRMKLAKQRMSMV